MNAQPMFAKGTPVRATAHADPEIRGRGGVVEGTSQIFPGQIRVRFHGDAKTTLVSAHVLMRIEEPASSVVS